MINIYFFTIALYPSKKGERQLTVV